MTVTLCGASDDLVEVEGDVHEEFNPADDDPSTVAFSDGTVLSIEYADDGCWRIHPLARGLNQVTITQAVSEDDDNYSDRAVVSGTIEWVLFATGDASRLVKAKT